MSDVGTTPRKPLTPRQRLAMWERHGGKCCVCGEKIDAVRDGGFVDEHIIPLALGGSNEDSNRGPAHKACARDKTSNDLTSIAKAKRVKARHLGIRTTSKSPLPGGRDSKWKRKMDGTVVPREPRR